MKLQVNLPPAVEDVLLHNSARIVASGKEIEWQTKNVARSMAMIEACIVVMTIAVVGYLLTRSDA